MKLLYAILIISISIISTFTSASAFSTSSSPAAETQPDNQFSKEELTLLEKCNLEARNSLVSNDIALVQKVCTQAMNTISKSHKDQKYIINPIMNLAFTYSLAGQFDKATPLYDRALSIGEKSFPADSSKLKKIRDVIKANKNMKKQKSQ